MTRRYNKVDRTGRHTKTMSDGRLLDVQKLWRLTAELPVHMANLEYLEVSKIDRSRERFSKGKYDDADLSFPILVHGRLLIDGRHRAAKAWDQGLRELPAKEVPEDIIDAAVIKVTK